MLSLNESVKQAVEIAQSLAREYHNPHFFPAHLLMGLLHKDVGLKDFITAIGQDAGYIQEWAEVRMEDAPRVGQQPDQLSGDEGVKRCFEESDNIRIKLGLDYITPICLLAALSKPGVAYSIEQLKTFPIKEGEVLRAFLQEDAIQSSVQGAANAGNNPPSDNSAALFKYCVDKTSQAREGRLDPIIGREKETRMMMEILCRRTKPNVVIIGDAGVGKTALIDGLAQDIIAERVPTQLKTAILFELDLGALIAGASYKGEVEDRLKKIIKEIKQYEKAILFIDEVHILMDPKGSFGSGPANLLKPELARGEITVIGATTIDEYRKFLEPDPAFVRRFEVLQVLEPTLDATQRMVAKLAPKFEEHHKLKTDVDALRESVLLARRYVKDRRLPDAAIDLLDRTMAAIKLMVDTNKQTLEELRNGLTDQMALNVDEADRFREAKWLHTLFSTKLSPVLLGMLNDETQVEKFELSSEYETYLDRSITKLSAIDISDKDTLVKEDLVAVIAYKTGIPMGKIQAQEKERLLNMENHLKHRVLGQDHAVKALTDAVLESRSGLNKKGQPIGSFFFLGPTGTGKTELAKSLAEFLFNDEKAMIRFDMSEFKEEHSAALLYGAPPGYVGYEEGGMLVNKIRKQPYSVLLFDEVEKAHPSVFDIFLQILDEGVMHDRLGKEGDFSNSIIIFTSNIGSEWIAQQFDKGQTPRSNELMEVMSPYFRPEFLARITEILPFAAISESSIVRIFDIQMRNLHETLLNKGISLNISDKAKQYLATDGFTPKYGARQITGVIRHRIRRPLSKYIVSGAINKGDNVNLEFDGNDLFWSINGNEIERISITPLAEITSNNTEKN
ncbi:MAG: ATP-dependent Clp protease ATP-binding subunit [Bacteroidetes bacterium]|nr:ATP-dependent Clp protease ATP-binding subunit [Bacteroidota bacterium]